MDFEFRRAREKLEKEQKDRKEKAKLRLERERKTKLEANPHREAIESAQRSRRIHAMEAQIKVGRCVEFGKPMSILALWLNELVEGNKTCVSWNIWIDSTTVQEHMELEKRYRELTDLLLEVMTSEKAAAEFQLEKEMKRIKEAQVHYCFYSLRILLYMRR
ncbi:putative Golgin subfamily A member 5 protein [Helianthus annuus]|nr:putative Golgin subfamily A member 5 protein [Helianthus annuus]